jgi:DNA invertase Pin-like site-specific DNA recombinase
VSGEAQEKEGESLPVQRQHIERSVELLGGTIVGWYGGQEHATGREGYERKELKRLVDDARKGHFDAVIMHRPDRWDRGSKEATEAKEVFKSRGISLFFGTSEYNLRNSEQELLVDMSAVIGKYDANNRRKVSLLSRIKRAKDGKPSSGKLPFGRTWDGVKWGVDPAKQETISDAAERYLKGERLRDLATEHGMNYANLCRVLQNSCGTSWVIDFEDEALGIHETVPLSVPRLLSDKVIKAVKARLAANRTYLHGSPKFDYLLSGRVFCAHCGYSMYGQPKQDGKYLYYFHNERDAAKECPIKPRPRVRAAKLDKEVVAQLFDMFGNPAQIQRAVKCAIPDCDKLLSRNDTLEGEVAKVVRGRERVLGLVAKDLLTDKQAEKQLLELKEREGGL